MNFVGRRLLDGCREKETVAVNLSRRICDMCRTRWRTKSGSKYVDNGHYSLLLKDYHPPTNYFKCYHLGIKSVSGSVMIF